MKDILELTATQIRIYKPDVLPSPLLGMGPNPEVVKSKFSFRALRQEPNGELTFSDGSLFRGSSGSIAVVALIIDLRRVVVQVLGSSADADVVHAAVWETLRQFSPLGQAFEDVPLTKSDECVCVATLNTGLENAVDQSLMRVLRDNADGLSNNFATPRAMEVSTLSFTIKYRLTEPELLDRGISTAEKVITLQPRTGTLPGENRVYFASPTDSTTHLKLLRQIEAALLQSESGR